MRSVKSSSYLPMKLFSNTGMDQCRFPYFENSFIGKSLEDFTLLICTYKDHFDEIRTTMTELIRSQNFRIVTRS